MNDIIEIIQEKTIKQNQAYISEFLNWIKESPYTKDITNNVLDLLLNAKNLGIEKIINPSSAKDYFEVVIRASQKTSKMVNGVKKIYNKGSIKDLVRVKIPKTNLSMIQQLQVTKMQQAMQSILSDIKEIKCDIREVIIGLDNDRVARIQGVLLTIKQSECLCDDEKRRMLLSLIPEINIAYFQLIKTTKEKIKRIQNEHNEKSIWTASSTNEKINGHILELLEPLEYLIVCIKTNQYIFSKCGLASNANYLISEYLKLLEDYSSVINIIQSHINPKFQEKSVIKYLNNDFILQQKQIFQSLQSSDLLN